MGVNPCSNMGGYYGREIYIPLTGCIARAKLRLLIGVGVWGMPPLEKNFKLVRFGVLFGSNFVFKKFQELPFLYRNLNNYHFYMKIPKITIFFNKNF